jgi:hypothetical protein
VGCGLVGQQRRRVACFLNLGQDLYLAMLLPAHTRDIASRPRVNSSHKTGPGACLSRIRGSIVHIASANATRRQTRLFLDPRVSPSYIAVTKPALRRRLAPGDRLRGAG